MKMLLGAGLLAAVVVFGFAGYMMFKPPAQASAPITAAPVAQAPTGAVAPDAVFKIDPNASSAKFVVDEILRGTPTTVVGTTNQVAGQIAADFDELDAAQVGPIRINARTLATDSDGRNRMLQNRILETEQHEYITFTPKRMVGLPDSVTVGERIAFQMVGDLTIKGAARETTFDVVVTPTTEDRLEGSATTTIRYADWGVSIPQVPSVAGVSEQLALQLDFVATAG
jgi:polyisoprenoid-binding protein YceI